MGGYVTERKLFLHVTHGKLVNKKEGKEFDGWVGWLTGIHTYEDEYEGNVVNKWAITMQDEAGENAIIQFTDETWFAVGFFSRITQIDLKQPFVLGVMQSEQNEKISFCYMKQNDQKIAKDENFPKPIKVKIGKKEGIDWTNVNARIDEIVHSLYAQGVANTTRERAKTPTEAPTPSVKEQNNTDLPF